MRGALIRLRGSSVSTVTRLRAERPQFDSRQGTDIFRRCVQTGSGTPSNLVPNGYQGGFPGVKRPGREANHSPLSSAEVENPELYIHSPKTSVYPEVSGLAAWSENCKWYISLPLGATLWVSLVSFAAITLCVPSQRVFIVVNVYFVTDSVRKLLDTPSCIFMACLWYMAKQRDNFTFTSFTSSPIYSLMEWCLNKGATLPLWRKGQCSLFWGTIQMFHRKQWEIPENLHNQGNRYPGHEQNREPWTVNLLNMKRVLPTTPTCNSFSGNSDDCRSEQTPSECCNPTSQGSLRCQCQTLQSGTTIQRNAIFISESCIDILQSQHSRTDRRNETAYRHFSTIRESSQVSNREARVCYAALYPV
jgi:hypothetical protein